MRVARSRQPGADTRGGSDPRRGAPGLPRRPAPSLGRASALACEPSFAGARSIASARPSTVTSTLTFTRTFTRAFTRALARAFTRALTLTLAITPTVTRAFAVTSPLAFSVAFAGHAGAVRADATLVAVATNFATTAAALAPGFEATTGHRVDFANGSTGKLYAQIGQGAPFDVLLAADATTPARLVADGRAVADTRFVYATGRLALWSARADRIGPDGAAALRDPSLRHLALANPALAPYGAAARTTLRRLGLWDALAPKVVLGQNVGQARALVASGAAELGFVAASQLAAGTPGDAGSHWLVPATLHEPIRQEAVLLARARDAEAARAFLAYLRTDAARALIRARGYDAP